MRAVVGPTEGAEGDGTRRARPPGTTTEATTNTSPDTAGSPSPSLTARRVLRLQRSAGNRAVARLVGKARGRGPGNGASPAVQRASGSAGATSARAGSQSGGTTAGPATGVDTATAAGTTTADAAGTALAAPGLAVQRRADPGGGTIAPPEPPTPLKPQEDPRFTKVTQDIAGTGKTLKTHPPANAEAKKASDAAQAPPGDKEAQAKAAQADKMSGAKPGGFDKAAFIAAVKKAVAAKAPKNLEEADEFSESGAADGIKSEVQGKVKQGKEGSAKDIATKTAEAPDPSKAKDKPVVPMKDEPPPKPGTPDTAGAMPAKAPPEQTDLRAGKADTDAQMAEADVSEDQLAKSNEPELQDALKSKKEGEQHSENAPGPVHEAEAQTLKSAEQAAGQEGKQAVAAMTQKRTGVQSQVTGNKGQAKSKDEGERQRITSEIRKIFDTTKADVDKILNDLDGAVDSKFTAGEATARAAFEADQKSRMDAYKEKRYSGILGKGRWLKDKLTRMPPEADALFLESKKIYESKMDVVISDVADHIGKELTRAKDRIAQGRADIDKFVASQPKELQKVAKDAAGEIGSQFDQLESDVDSKQDQLVDDIATKYVEAKQAVDDRIKELQEANKGLWEKAKDAIGGAIQTIIKLKNMLLGVLSRAAGAIGKIIKDPIGFLGKLINAVKGGVMKFAGNIVEHLKKGMQGWLFGALASAGIEIPDSFDLKGIIKLVLSILGLTWTAIRTKIVKRIGEPAMNAVEKGVDIFKTLATEGIGGLWKFLMDKLSSLKDTVMDAIQDFVVVKIVKAGITWLISALNPAAAFIKACKMIYDVVMFFVEKGSQIKEFVDSVLDSVEEIASGAVGKVVGLIENTLAKILPLLIGFLASLLGLGGISEKIKEILQKVQKPVGDAIDFVINGALKLARPIINLAKKGIAKGKALYEKGKAKVKSAYEAGKAKVKEKFGRKPKPREDLPEDKQQHVDMAAREIEPKARALLAKGVSEDELQSKLQGWKSEYRLTDLSIEHKGENFDITAKVNPTANVIRNAVDMVGTDLNRTLRSIGEELLGDPAVQEEVTRIRQARESQVAAGRGSKNQPISRPAESTVAEAASLRPPTPGEADPRRPAGQFEQVTMGSQQVLEQQTRSQAPGNIHTQMEVMVDGVLMHNARYSPEIQTALQQMEATGISRTDIKQGMFDLAANRPLGPAFAAHPQARDQLAAITRLMFVVEPARNPAAFSTSFMGASMAADPNVPLTDVVTAANPMHVGGAGAMSRTAAANLAAEAAGERERGGRGGLNAELMLMAERDVVISYLESMVRSKELTFDSQHAVERFLRKEFRDHLLQRMRAAFMRETAASG